ncbi:MAG: carboxypeptidase regulatory-like domain-containing protein [Planctomycetes bacterium]|nr:carboxypeptidase regulatory-like domain-containing protein [Planctomycetota bacterium]
MQSGRSVRIRPEKEVAPSVEKAIDGTKSESRRATREPAGRARHTLLVTVRDADARAVAGCKIEVIPAPSGVFTSSFVTDERGELRLERANLDVDEHGKLRLVPELLGFDSLAKEVDLDRADRVDFVLPPHGSIKVRMVDALGRGIPRAHVRFVDPSGRDRQFERISSGTDYAEFSRVGLHQSWWCNAHAPGFLDAIRQIKGPVRGGEEVVVDLDVSRDSAVIRGTAVLDGVPCSEADCILASMGTQVRFETDASGKFSVAVSRLLIDRAPRGELRLLFMRNDSFFQAMPLLPLSRGRDYDVGRVLFQPLRTIATVRVTEDGEHPDHKVDLRVEARPSAHDLREGWSVDERILITPVGEGRFVVHGDVTSSASLRLAAVVEGCCPIAPREFVPGAAIVVNAVHGVTVDVEVLNRPVGASKALSCRLATPDGLVLNGAVRGDGFHWAAVSPGRCALEVVVTATGERVYTDHEIVIAEAPLVQTLRVDLLGRVVVHELTVVRPGGEPVRRGLATFLPPAVDGELYAVPFLSGRLWLVTSRPVVDVTVRTQDECRTVFRQVAGPATLTLDDPIEFAVEVSGIGEFPSDVTAWVRADRAWREETIIVKAHRLYATYGEEPTSRSALLSGEGLARLSLLRAGPYELGVELRRGDRFVRVRGSGKSVIVGVDGEPAHCRLSVDQAAFARAASELAR